MALKNFDVKCGPFSVSIVGGIPKLDIQDRLLSLRLQLQLFEQSESILLVSSTGALWRQ